MVGLVGLVALPGLILCICQKVSETWYSPRVGCGKPTRTTKPTAPASSGAGASLLQPVLGQAFLLAKRVPAAGPAGFQKCSLMWRSTSAGTMNDVRKLRTPPPGSTPGAFSSPTCRVVACSRVASNPRGGRSHQQRHDRSKHYGTAFALGRLRPRILTNRALFTCSPPRLSAVTRPLPQAFLRG
jgi:hypothetical protein